MAQPFEPGTVVCLSGEGVKDEYHGLYAVVLVRSDLGSDRVLGHCYKLRVLHEHYECNVITGFQRNLVESTKAEASAKYAEDKLRRAP